MENKKYCIYKIHIVHNTSVLINSVEDHKKNTGGLKLLILLDPTLY
jgi:hypothetical protein